MSIGIANFQTLFQSFYPEIDLQYLIPDNLPLLNAVPKTEYVSGDVIDHPFLYGTPAGYSTDFNVAQTQAGNAPRAVRASLRMSQAYKNLEFLDKDTILSQGQDAYADLFQKTVEGAFALFYNQMDMEGHGSGTGWRGTVAALPGTANPTNGATLPANTISLTSALPLEATFDQDQQLQFATYAGFPLLGSIFPPSDGRQATTLSPIVQVTAVDPIAQTLTLSDASQATVGCFVVQAGGAVGFSSANLYGGLIGMDAWQPYGGVPATGDNFCGINRQVYNTRLAGYYFDGSRLSMEDAVKRLSAKMSLGGARSATLCLMHPLDVDALDSKMMTFGRYSTFDTAMYGFDSIVIKGAAGRIDVVSDPHQARGFARLVDASTWVIYHRLALPHVVDVDGRTVEQGLNFDGRTARIRAYFQMACYEPHKNGIVKLPQVLIG
jgi:hypothetical protein